MKHSGIRIGPWIAVGLAALALSLLVGAALYNLHQQNVVDKKLCESTLQNRDSIRSSWNAVRTFLLATVEQDSDTTELEKAEARIRTNSFIEIVLRPIPPLQCVDNKPVPRGG